MKTPRLWPQGLVGQAALILLSAVLLESIGSAVLLERADVSVGRGDQARHLAEHILVVEQDLSALPKALRPARAEALATPGVAVAWDRAPSIPDDAASRSLTRLEQEMVAARPALSGRDLRLSLDAMAALPFAPRRAHVALQLSDGSWARLTTNQARHPWYAAASGVGSAVILTLGVLAAGGLMLRALGAPLRTLSDAADRVGSGQRVHVREEGPRDIKRVARAFNAMQDRIADLTQARLEALAAVGHDLRTPLSRLRLRVESIENGPARRAAESDISEMSAMLSSLLGYLRGDEPEAPRLCDVAALAMTVVDDARDRGERALYAGPDSGLATVRALALKRALANLVDNAIIYGGKARVGLEVTDADLILTVEDEGPGIPPELVKLALEPFQRLDGARARNTGGMGLGLSIVAAIVREQNGRLTLANRPQGGLRAEIRLPRKI